MRCDIPERHAYKIYADARLGLSAITWLSREIRVATRKPC